MADKQIRFGQNRSTACCDAFCVTFDRAIRKKNNIRHRINKVNILARRPWPEISDLVKIDQLHNAMFFGCCLIRKYGKIISRSFFLILRVVCV